MKVIPHFCQSCGQANTLGEYSCQNCGTRLMLVIFPPSIRHDESIVPSFYEDHLLERVTLLENRLSQVAERLAMALDLMLKQTKSTQSDHLLLETLIDSLNSIGSIEKKNLTQKWRKRIETEERDKKFVDRLENIFEEIWTCKDNPSQELFSNLTMEGMKFLLEAEEKQALRVLERAARLAPQNVPLMVFIAENLFRIDKPDAAREYLEKAIALQPKKEKALFLLGVIYADNLEIEKSRQILKLLSRSHKTNFCLSYIEGMCAAYEENWFEMTRHFKGLAENFYLPETNYLLGCAYSQISSYKTAARFIQNAVEADPGFADAWFMLSVIYAHLHDEAKSQQTRELAWSAGEPGAQCLEFLKNRDQANIQTSLPFIRLKNLKKHLVTGGSLRFSKLIREEIFNTLDNLK